MGRQKGEAPEPLLPTHSHADLVLIARRWLYRNGCGFVFSEYGAGPEIPDALGFLGASLTLLIEVKVSRSDFLADKRKPWRADPAQGLGDYRYYMAPKGLLRLEDIPDGWGFLEVDQAGRVRRVRDLAVTAAGSQLSVLHWYARNYRTNEMTTAEYELLMRYRAERWEKNEAAELHFMFSACARLAKKNCWGILKTDMNNKVVWEEQVWGPGGWTPVEKRV